MKYSILVMLLFFMTFNASAQELFEFTAQYGSGSEFIDEAEHIARDSNGNYIIFGSFGEQTDFDFGEGQVLVEPLGSPDLFVAKYAPDGSLFWVNSIGRIALNNGIFAEGLAIDDSDNIIIAGGYINTIDFDPSPEVNTLTSNGGSDAFIATYSSDGAYVSAVGIGGIGSDLISALAIGNDNSLYCGLRFNDEVDVDFGENEVLLTPNGAADAALVKYSADGSYLFSHQVGTSGNDQITSLGLGPQNEIVLGAFINGIASGIPQQELFIEVLSSDAVPLWDHGFTNPATNNVISGLGFSQDQNSLYVSGRFQAPTDFDTSMDAEFTLNPQFADIFFAKYDLFDGSFIWAKHILGSGVEDYSVAITEAGQAAMVAGSFETSAFFEPGDFSTQLTTEGSSDVFLAAYDRDSGDFISVQSFGGEGAERAINGKFMTDGELMLAGSFSESLDLDPLGVNSIPSHGFVDFFFGLFQYDIDLSASSQITEADIKVYPIPSNGIVNFSLPGEFLNETIQLRIISVVGQVVEEYSFEDISFSGTIDISTLNKGVYLMEFDLGFQSFTKRIVKN